WPRHVDVGWARRRRLLGYGRRVFRPLLPATPVFPDQTQGTLWVDIARQHDRGRSRAIELAEKLLGVLIVPRHLRDVLGEAEDRVSVRMNGKGLGQECVSQSARRGNAVSVFPHDRTGLGLERPLVVLQL